MTLDLERLESEVYNRNKQVLSSVQESIHAASEAVNTLTGSGWKGEAQEAFDAKFQRCQSDMAELCVQIQNLQQALEMICKDGDRMAKQHSKSVERTL